MHGIVFYVRIEPECAVTDCWAQGSVPKNIYPSTPRDSVLEALEEEPEAQPETDRERLDPVNMC